VPCRSGKRKQADWDRLIRRTGDGRSSFGGEAKLAEVRIFAKALSGGIERTSRRETIRLPGRSPWRAQVARSPGGRRRRSGRDQKNG